MYSSPLENMHASTVLRIINNHTNISLIRKKRIAKMILSTDNINHKDKIKKMSKISL